MLRISNWKPDCLHAEPKGRLAPVRADYWRCGVRGRDVYNSSDCENCPSHKPRAARPANKENVTAMPKQRHIQWDEPANITIPEGPASKPLWEHCQSLGNVAAAKRLGLASSSVSVAISKRAKAQAAAAAAVPPAGCRGAWQCARAVPGSRARTRPDRRPVARDHARPCRQCQCRPRRRQPVGGRSQASHGADPFLSAPAAEARPRICRGAWQCARAVIPAVHHPPTTTALWRNQPH